MTSTVRCLTSMFHENSFTWTINNLKEYTDQSSDLFQVCGYRCYFFFSDYSHVFQIQLCGYPASHKKKISCRYSIILKNNYGAVYTSKIGEIQTEKEEERIGIIIIRDTDYPVPKSNIDHLTLFFSWCENGDYEVSSQGVQTEQGMSTNGIECATQTEDVQFPYTRKLSPNAEISANIIESSTQTEPTSSTGDISINKENDNYKFLEILSKDLGSFYESKTDPDCVLKVDKTEFHVHRSVLAARSTVFGAMFHHDTSESRSGEVNIQDVDAVSLGDVLYYIYTGKIRGLSPDTATTMYVVADKYALVDLREKCLDFLMRNLTVENVGDAALLAHTHAEMKLEDKVTEFIEERLDDLDENESWKIFADTHSKLANKLLFSALRSSKKKLAK